MKDKLVYGVESNLYGSSSYHKLMIDNTLGENGENLTIMVLMYNRADATIKLYNSINQNIPNFKGKVLFIDNGSSISEIKKLQKEIKKSEIDVKVINLGKNHGVSGGRNLGIEYVETDWVLSLDNDIYLTGNPIESINNTLKLFGCHFVNVPLMDEKGEKYFLNGGHLYIDTIGDNIDVGGGSLFQQIEINNYIGNSPTLSTFFCGGASVFKKETFIQLGKYDEEYFIGFEDIDFSIRIFRAGLKIGNCTGNYLIHNHVIDNNKDSIAYERNRFSSEILYNSAMHFEKKWGFRVWNKNTALWLEQRQKDLKISESQIKNRHIEKPKIALVVDVYNWCFWNISKQLEKNLKDVFDIEILVMNNQDDIYKVLIYLSKFDLVHFFWRGHLLWVTDAEEFENIEFLKRYGITYEYYKNEILKKTYITTSIYDHLFIDDNIDDTKRLMKYVKKYTTSSKILFDIYNDLSIEKKPTISITDGVDLAKFYITNKDKYENIQNRKIIFGWVGNSAWNDADIDFKGFNTIIKPVLEELQEKGYPVETYFADKQIRQIPFDKMNEYYNSIDVLLCASKAEGTPNPVLEAMATGTVVISTNVGIVSEAVGKKQSKYILKERSKGELKNKIINLLEHPEEFEKIQKENLEMIKKWTWEIKAKEFGEFFSKCIEEQNRDCKKNNNTQE